MINTKVTCPSCGTSNSSLLKKCQSCNAPLVPVNRQPTSSPPSAPAARPRVPSGTHFRLDGEPLEMLKRLCEPFNRVETRCTECGEPASVSPPFNLDRFACGNCGAEMYPFVWVDDCLVDLNGMRELLAAIHTNAAVAPKALRGLKTEGDRGLPVEPLLHVATIAAHSVVACTRAAGPQLAWWTLAGVLHPGLLGALGFVQFGRERHVEKEVIDRLLLAELSRSSFDPRVLPPFQPNKNTGRLLKQLYLSGGWPRALLGGAESYGVFGATEQSTWSLVFDRRERTDGGVAPRISSSDFVAQVAAEVVNSERDRDIIRTEHSLALARVNDLPADSPLREHLIQSDGSQDQSSPLARRVSTPARIIETVNLSTGHVEWSVMRSQDQGPMLGVRWSTFHRSAWARGVGVDGNVVDPSRALAAEAERKAILEAEGNFFEQLSEAIPPWVKSASMLIPIFFAAWIWLSVATGASSPFGTDSPELNGVRGAFALLWGLVWWSRYKKRRNPFPLEFWTPKELGWIRAKAQRIENIRKSISKLWRNFDYSPKWPISRQLGAIRGDDRLDREQAAFAVHCEDRLIQDAIIDVGERHGIDMSKFKEGIQQINNYGVIASKIDGPVAAGDGATANQTTSIPGKIQAAVNKTILKKDRPQAGAA